MPSHPLRLDKWTRKEIIERVAAIFSLHTEKITFHLHEKEIVIIIHVESSLPDGPQSLEWNDGKVRVL